MCPAVRRLLPDAGRGGLFVKRFFIIVGILLLLIVVCGGIVAFNLFRDSAIKQYFATMKPPAATVSTVIVKPSEWTPGVEAIGTVNAVRGVDLTVETAGIVKSIMFHANQKVADNAVLLQLDDAVERADLAAAKAQNVSDQTALERAVELQRRGVGTDATLDTARATASASASQVNKLQAVLDQKQLTAPFAGTVGIPKIDLGQYLATGSSVVTLQDLDTMRVDFSVPEQQLPLLKIGQTLKVPAGGTATVAAAKPVKVDPVTTATTQPAAKPTETLASYTPPKKDAKVIQQAEDDDAVAPDATGIGKMRWPVRGRVISNFGGGKDGVDIAVPEGTPVKAAENGVVIYAGDGLKEFGNTVLVRHENGLVTVYGHASSIEVQRGQKVKRGQEIALSGMSGTTDSPKLHFEVRKNSAPVDPSGYLE
ncbi:efflux RND transporter periplasmic adaptor subunit [Mesorhizobium sp.]|uniref:efflux RND transporter periplasmic adaptor subunit n=1 Tax=Mesorhizobium sp. TaxID=1871066 RepID=UPI0025CE062D|nr:efflux RND transporter periplasmic adaptor subunit [Mesorhizobium sp.]